ncbi:DNA endonuclease SmrA [Erwinia sorbitola]|uniref:DNA endonuclease SmrA n=1 Tax=Erwinia sorbitola TaxID=2681984 RepID=A0A6I6ES78_9GAMM|nr:DNA endonuclease SmrA [Erwinia sorbitola]MTD25991.1 DNA endonuclease SmrA [Erwinia sorbitola]QGU89681.1 DNA endonuclease SmrA [Erwinia sorbitola]
MNADEQDLFKHAMEDVKPLKTCAATLWLKTPPARRDVVTDPQLDNPLTTGLLDIVPLTVPLEYKAEGIQQGVLDKLSQGKYPPQATLNLLRHTVEQCRQALYLFMLQSTKYGLRNVLIVHGKGRDDASHANIVRSYLMRWLPQFDDVQAFCAARPQDGGSGACYVGLRKNEQARLENRERHAKHSR